MSQTFISLSATCANSSKISQRHVILFFYTADHFKEICPAGHGYTYSLSDVQISVRHLGEDGVQSTGLSWEEQSRLYPHIPSSHPSLPFGPQHPSYPQTPQIPQYPEYPETPQVPQDPLAPQQPVYPFHPAGESLEQPEGENEKWPDGKSLPGNVYSEWLSWCSWTFCVHACPNTVTACMVLTATHRVNNAGQFADRQFCENTNINRMLWSCP